MNIGLDGIYATNGSSDSERYTRYLIEALSTEYAEDKVYVYTPKVTKKTRWDVIDQLHNVEYRMPAASGFQGAMWRAFGITNCLQSDKVELYHGVNGILPMNIASAHLPTVVTIHEPDHEVPGRVTSWWKRTVALHWIGASVRAATRVIVFSENIKQQLYDRFRLDLSKVDMFDAVEDTTLQTLEVYHKAMAEFKG